VKKGWQLPAYSLLEASIGMIIMGLVVATLVPAIQKYRHYYKHKLTQERAASISKRVQSWFSRRDNYKRSLCPAAPETYGSPQQGKSLPYCELPTQRIGVVPYQELELLPKDTVDGYGHRFTFVMVGQKNVVEDLSVQSGLPTDKVEECENSFQELGVSVQLENVEDTQEFKHEILGLLITHGAKGMGAFEKKAGQRVRRAITLEKPTSKQKNARDDLTFSQDFRGVPARERDEIFIIYKT